MEPARAERGIHVSIVVPLRDEEERVEDLVASIAQQDFAGELEVMVADGGSRDRSVERLEAAARRAGVRLAVVQNRAGLIPYGLNACVRRARGDFVVRMDCRGRYGRDYVSRCVAAARESGAWNVGGRIVPEGRGRGARALACAMDSPFGGIGWTRHRSGSDRVEVDTVYCGTFPQEVFGTVGLFDESLPWNEDEDFNLRIRRAGGRVLLDPGIRVGYDPPRSLGGLLTRYRRYGAGKVELMRKHRAVLSARSLAPLTLITSTGALILGSTRWHAARGLLVAEVSLYAAAAVAFAGRSMHARNEPWTLLPHVAARFVAMHLGYGVGMALGILRALHPRNRVDRTTCAEAYGRLDG